MEKKQYFFVILIPAIIAGLFSLAPTIYQKITEPKVNFNYSISQGPTIQEDSFYKKIIVVTINNDGQKLINNINGQIFFENGLIKSYSFKDTNLLTPNVTNNINDICFKIQSMLPSDSISFSLLIEATIENPQLNISIRSDESLAIDNNTINNKPIEYISILSAILAGLSVLLMALTITKSKSLQKTVFSLVKIYKNDLLFYLSILLQDDEISDVVMKNETISYMRMSDLIYRQYTLTPDEKYRKGQFCLYIINEMANSSKCIVKLNLSKMDLPVISFDSEKQVFSKIKNEHLSLRSEFDRIFDLGIDEYIKSKQSNNGS